MNERVKDLWVKALRSEKYSQTTRRLRDLKILSTSQCAVVELGTGFCCLGVLCDLYAKEHSSASWEPDPDAQQCYFHPGGNASGDDELLPRVVRDWAGMASDDGMPQTDAARVALREARTADNVRSGRGNIAAANDHGLQFSQLADFIEANWEAL